MAKSKKETEVVETETPEVSEQDLAIRAAFDNNIGQDEEDVKMAMLQAGCKIKAVARLYNTYMIDSGQMATAEEKKDALEANLPGMDLSTEEGFVTAVEAIQAGVTGATEKSAASMVRAWAKKNDAEVYKKPAGAPRTDTFTYRFNEALIANPQMTEAECDEILKTGSGTSSARSYFQGLRKLGNSIHANMTGAEAA